MTETKQGGALNKHKSTTELFSGVYGGEKTSHSSSWIFLLPLGKDWTPLGHGPRGHTVSSVNNEKNLHTSLFSLSMV